MAKLEIEQSQGWRQVHLEGFIELGLWYSSGSGRFIFLAVVFGEGKMFLESCPGFFGLILLAPLLTITVEQASSFNVLISSTDELGIIDIFVSTGRKFLSFLKLVEESDDRFKGSPLTFLIFLLQE